MTDSSNPSAQPPEEAFNDGPTYQFGQPPGDAVARSSDPTVSNVQPTYPVAYSGSSSGTRGMYTAAAVINWITLAIVSVATFGIGLIAAFWVVPMTIAIHKGAKGPYKHTALGVCTLLFINIISGILMLVDDSNRPAKPV